MRKNITRQATKSDQAARRQHRLSRFTPLFRDRIASLTCCAPEAEDVADSFPALLVALVSNYNSPASRQKSFSIVLEGGSVKAAAEALDLPLWLKKVPPEAFKEPLSGPNNDPQLTAKILNFIPPKTSSTGDWFSQVSSAGDTCDGGFALWVAKHCASVAPSRRQVLFMSMASWAWHADRPDTVGHAILDKPWSSKMGLRRATEELMRWRRRVDLACAIGDGIESPWLRPGTVGAYDFVPLLTLSDFMEESRAMNNCLDQYADRLSTGLIRIFSIRRKGKPVADLEVGPISSTGLPAIVQIKAASNRQAPRAVWQAAQTWLENQDYAGLAKRPGALRRDGPALHAFWGAYLDWLPHLRRKQFEALVLNGGRRKARLHMPHPIVDVPASELADANL